MNNLLKTLAELQKNPSISCANRLNEEIKLFNDRRILQRLQDELLFALITLIDSGDQIKNSQEFKTAIIKSITQLLISVKINIVQHKVISVVLVKEVFIAPKTILRPNLSEEIKLATVDCLFASLNALTLDGYTEFYMKENTILISHIVFICLEIIRRETYRTLRISGIKCLMAAFHVQDSCDFTDIVLRKQVADISFVMIPKVILTLYGVINGEEKQGRTLITCSVRALGRILCIVFEDYDKRPTKLDYDIKDFEKLIKNSLDLNEKPNQKLDDSKILAIGKDTSLGLLIRTEEWLEAAIKKIKTTLDAMKKLIGNPVDTIRMELADASIQLFEKVSDKLRPHIGHLLESIIALTQDENKEISEKCKTFLNLLNEDQQQNTRLSSTSSALSLYLNNIEQIFIHHLIELPRLIYGGDEDEQMGALQLLKGLLTCLCKTRLKTIFCCSDTLDRFMTILLSAVEIDRGSMDLLNDEYSIRNVDAAEIQDGINKKLVWREMKHLRSKRAIMKIQEICQIIGRSNAVDIIFEYLMDLLVNDDRVCNEVLIILQYILALNGWGETNRINTCLEELLEERHWNLTIQANRNTNLEMIEFGESDWYEDRTEGLYEAAISVRYTDVRWRPNEDSLDLTTEQLTIAIAEAKFNILHICLVVETIGQLSICLRQAYQPFLMRSLHRILEKAGSSNYAIHLAGTQALNNLSTALSYESVSELIHQNADYITHFINISLKRTHETKNTLDLLSVVLRYSSIDSVPYLENILITVMDENAKFYQKRNMTAFLKVFQMLVIGFSEWLNSDNNENNENNTTENNIENKIIIETFNKWLDILDKPLYYENEMLNECSNDEPPKPNQSDETAVSDDVELLPKYAQITLKILKRCIQYLSVQNKMDKCLVLETIIVGFKLIKSWENHLLPMCHLLWPLFVERVVSDNDPVVLRKSFHLLVLLAQLAKDFLYKRITKDIFPVIIKFLKHSLKSSNDRLHDVSYEKSIEFKFLCEIFFEFPEIIQHIEIMEKDLNQLLDAGVPYLNQQLHRSIVQENCVQFFIKLARFDAAAVFVKLYDFQEDKLFTKNVTSIFIKIL